MSVKENMPSAENDTSLGSQVFSPLRDAMSNQNNLSANHIITPSSMISSRSRMSNDSIFSPLRETNSLCNTMSPATAAISSASNSTSNLQLQLMQQKTPLGSFDLKGISGTPPALSSIREEEGSILSDRAKVSDVSIKNSENSKKNSDKLQKEDLARADSGDEVKEKEPESVSEEMVLLSTTTPYFLPKSVIKQGKELVKDTTANANACDKHNNDASNSIDKAAINNFSDLVKKQAHVSVARSQSLKSNNQDQQQYHVGGGGGVDKVDAFKHEFVQAAVQEAMDEFCDDMRKQLWHIQYDMIRNFQKQKEEIQLLMRNYAVNEQLLAEVQHLREENQRLKATPFVAHFSSLSCPQDSEKAKTADDKTSTT